MNRPSVLFALLLGPAGPAFAQEGACAGFPAGEARHECTCPAEAPARTVWGSGPYTADSDLCTAARHAGVIGADGGRVVALAVDPPASYPGSLANGVTTADWGSYDTAFAFEGVSGSVGVASCRTLPPLADVTCGCPASGPIGTVWGSDPYTADSDLCTAARHAGVIGEEGGEITLRRIAGQQAYEGSDANGVTTLPYGAYRASVTFRPKP